MHQSVTSEEGGGISKSRLDSIKKSVSHPAYTRKILVIVKLLIGLAFLFLSVRGIQWSSLVTGIRSAHPTWLVLAISSVVMGLMLKLWRWSIFIKNYHIKPGLSRLFSAYFVGQAGNIVMPLRSGEVIRMGYFVDDPKILPAIVSTIALEKYLDLLALTVCAILISLKFSVDNILNLRGWLLPLTIILTMLLLAVLLFGTSIWKKLRIRKLPKRIVEWMDGLVETSRWLKEPGKIFPGILLTILIWIVMWLTNLVLFKSLGIQPGGTAAGLVLVCVYIGLLPALMPGNIGPFYFFASLALVPFGISHDLAFLFAVVLHAIVTIPPVLGGVIGLSIRTDRVVHT